VAAAVGGLLAVVAACYADEAEAVKALKKTTATIQYDNKAPGKPVKSVNISDGPVKDSDLKWMKEVKHLRFLGLHGTQVTDAGMRELKDLKTLQELRLSSTKIADAGLRELNGL